MLKFRVPVQRRRAATFPQGALRSARRYNSRQGHLMLSSLPALLRLRFSACAASLALLCLRFSACASLPALLCLRFSACASHLSVVVRPIHHQFHTLSPYKILLIPYLVNYFVLPQIVATVFNYFGVPYFPFPGALIRGSLRSSSHGTGLNQPVNH